MATEAFITKSFRRETLALIYQANEIIAELQAAGYTLTVRQLYYQFVARGLLENKQENYKRLASVLDDARKAGLMDWDAIEDRTRTIRGFGPAIPLYASPSGFMEKEAKSYYFEDAWAEQENYVEVWVEKDALLGVIERPCHALRVPYFACRGYASSSALYAAGKRFREKADEGKTCYLLHLGDHDPSGLDMTRENRESVNTFGNPSITEIAERDGYDDDAVAEENRDFEFDPSLVTVKRLALNMDQVRRYNPPPNPAKEADARFEGYVKQHGKLSWELDALDPPVIDKLIRDAITDLMDEDAFKDSLEREAGNRDKLMTVARYFGPAYDAAKAAEDADG
jgi:hypothetical protein